MIDLNGASPAVSQTAPMAFGRRQNNLTLLADGTGACMDQRYVPLSFTAGSGTLTATAPANQNIAPPGPYMLFVVNADGVPSVARTVTVPPFNAPPAVIITQPASGAVFDAPATINIAASATDGVSVAKVGFFNGATKLGEDLTAPRAVGEHRRRPTAPTSASGRT